MKASLVALCVVFLWALAGSVAVTPEEFPARPDAVAPSPPAATLTAMVEHGRTAREPAPGARQPTEAAPSQPPPGPSPEPPPELGPESGSPALTEIWNDADRLRLHFASAMMDCECHDVCEEDCTLVCAHEQEYRDAWDRSPQLFALYGSRLALIWNGEADWGTEQVLDENWTAILREVDLAQ